MQPVCNLVILVYTPKTSTCLMHPPPPLFARTQKKKAASKNAATHPTTTVITALKDKKGSSHAAIKKYIPANYKIDIVKLGPFCCSKGKELKEGCQDLKHVISVIWKLKQECGSINFT